MSDKSPDLCGELQQETDWKSVGYRLLVGLCLLSVVVYFGRFAVHEIKAMEDWVASHGLWGWAGFLIMTVVLTSMLVPDTLLAVAAGAMFGLLWGTMLTVVAATITAVLNFLAAQSLLRPWIEKMLEQHPKLQAIRQAANRKGLQLQLLLRLAPINPVSVSYVMGASGIRFSTFLIGTAGLIPGLFVEVYLGHLASHLTKVAGNASEHSTLHTVVTIVGFVLSIIVLISITRIAAKALADAEIE